MLYTEAQERIQAELRRLDMENLKIIYHVFPSAEVDSVEVVGSHQIIETDPLTVISIMALAFNQHEFWQLLDDVSSIRRNSANRVDDSQIPAYS